MPRPHRQKPRGANSPLVELEAEVRALNRKRETIARDEGRHERRFEPQAQIKTGSWSDLEHTVWLERAA